MNRQDQECLLAGCIFHACCARYMLRGNLHIHGAMYVQISMSCTYTVQCMCRFPRHVHTLCNVCAGFHVTYIHEIGEERKNQYHASFVCVRFSKGGGVGEKRLVFVSKKRLVFTDDP